jgi:hypothetical protein
MAVQIKLPSILEEERTGLVAERLEIIEKLTGRVLQHQKRKSRA